MRLPLLLDREHALETLRWVRTVGTAGVLGVLLLNTDYVVVSRVLGESANGLYSYAYRFAFVPFIMIAFVIGGVAFPVYTRLVERDGVGALGAAFARIVHAQVALTGGLYLLLALLAPRIVLINERWAPSAPVLRVLCLYGLVLCLVQACHDAVRAAGRPGLYLRAMAVHLTLLLATAITFVHLGGIVGVAWAQVLSASLTLLLVGTFLWRIGVLPAPVRASLRRALLGPALAAGATTAVFVGASAAGLMPAVHSMPGLPAAGAGLAACYAGVLWLVDRAALRELRSVLGR
jgi:PST family polysaccharide transporter